jgi:mannose-6-phosphate isomerase-like protein (cupin superfamily)
MSGSHQPRHEEQVYVIVRGQGQRLLGDEERPVREGTLVVGPPGTEHAIRNTGSGLLVYVSATAPPFAVSIADRGWEPRDLAGS